MSFVDAHGVVVDDAQFAAAIDARGKSRLGIDIAMIGEAGIAVEVVLAHEAGVAGGALHGSRVQDFPGALEFRLEVGVELLPLLHWDVFPVHIYSDAAGQEWIMRRRTFTIDKHLPASIASRCIDRDLS